MKHVQRPVMDRVEKVAALCVKKVAALAKLVSRFHGDVTSTQRDQLVDLTDKLVTLQDLSGEVGSIIAMLRDSGYRPRMSGGGGRTPLQSGQLVRIKGKKYHPEFHGSSNDDLVIVKAAGPNALIKHGAKGAPFPIPRSYLEVVDDNENVEESKESSAE